MDEKFQKLIEYVENNLYYRLNEDKTATAVTNPLEATISGNICRVAWTDLGVLYVSTIFTGINRSIVLDPQSKDQPALWETAVLSGLGTLHDERWISHEMALAGHKRIVFKLRHPLESLLIYRHKESGEYAIAWKCIPVGGPG